VEFGALKRWQNIVWYKGVRRIERKNISRWCGIRVVPFAIIREWRGTAENILKLGIQEYTQVNGSIRDAPSPVGTGRVFALNTNETFAVRPASMVASVGYESITNEAGFRMTIRPENGTS
jgi:hypothetical protein